MGGIIAGSADIRHREVAVIDHFTREKWPQPISNERSSEYMYAMERNG